MNKLTCSIVQPHLKHRAVCFLRVLLERISIVKHLRIDLIRRLLFFNFDTLLFLEVLHPRGAVIIVDLLGGLFRVYVHVQVYLRVYHFLQRCRLVLLHFLTRCFRRVVLLQTWVLHRLDLIGARLREGARGQLRLFSLPWRKNRRRLD